MNSDKLKSRQPPDGGYGWVVVFAGAVCFGLVVGLARVSGFIFLGVIEKYHVTRTQASVLFVVSRLISFGGTPVASFFVGKFTYTTLLCIGGIIWFASLVLSSFTTSLWQLIITYGFTLGLGTPFITSISTLVIGVYFKKRRALAMSIFFATSGAGGFLIPPLFEIILEHYGFNSALFIYAAIMLHVIPCGLLVREPDWLPSIYNEQTRRRRNVSEMTSTSSITKVENHEVEKFISNGIHEGKAKRPRKKNLCQRLLASTRYSAAIFKDPLFLLLLSSRILTMIPLFNLIQLIPDFIQTDLALDMSKTDVAFMLSMTSVGDILSRLSVGTVMAKLPFHLKYSYMFWSCMSGVVAFTLLLANSYALLLASHVLFGLCLGTVVVTQFILEAEMMGTERTPLAHGINQAISGTVSVIFLMIIGYIRDSTGSYRIGMYIMGSAGVAGGLIWLLEPCLVRCLPPLIKPQPSLEKFPEGEGYMENAV